MFGDKSTARWIAIIAIFVGAATCAACLFLVLILTTTYGGQTVRLRNPLAPPTQIVTNNTTTGSTTTNGTTGSTTGTTGTTSTTTTSGNVTGASGGSAAAYLPEIGGYTSANAASIEGAINLFSQSAGSGSTFSAQSLTGVIATNLILSRLDDFIGCYRQVGAVDARVYIQTSSLLSGEVPPAGAIVVLNQDLLRDNLVSCAIAPADPNAFSAQAANQPCGNFGDFIQNGQRFTYLYAGTSSTFCDSAARHFAQFGG